MKPSYQIKQENSFLLVLKTSKNTHLCGMGESHSNSKYVKIMVDAVINKPQSFSGLTQWKFVSCSCNRVPGW